MAGMKIIPLIAAGDDRVRDDLILILRTMVHAIRVDLTHRLDEMQSQIIGLQRRVDRLEEPRETQSING
jgi:hypothetical protein